jgi:hypothetical protein
MQALTMSGGCGDPPQESSLRDARSINGSIGLDTIRAAMVLATLLTVTRSHSENEDEEAIGVDDNARGRAGLAA